MNRVKDILLIFLVAAFVAVLIVSAMGATKRTWPEGVKAVELAKRALELDTNVGFLDTLAAAYAEAGRFEDAIMTQEKAIALSKKERYLRKAIDGFVDRLNSYKANKPWREK